MSTMKNYPGLIKINSQSIIPKYMQIAEAILAAIKSEKVAKNEILPSLHSLCTMLDISKTTAEKAYNTLKQQGIVGSFKGKGYYAIDNSS